MPVGKQQNLKVSYQFIEFVQSANRAIIGHLYKFTSAAGALDYFTDLDTDISWDNATYKSGSLRIENFRRKIGIGAQVDEQTVQIWATPTDTLFGSNFLTGAAEGLLDGALISRSRAIWPFATGNAATDVQAQPLAVYTLFTGYMSEITKGGASHIECKVKSPLVKLETNMPRNYYQASCLWTLFDTNCALNKNAFANAGVVGTAPGATTIPVSGGTSVPVAADGIANFAQGRLLFTSGVNSGLQVLIDNNDANNLFLAYPLVALPSPGDTFTYYPGCSKAFKTCNLKFANTANIRNFDRVPPVMLSL